MDSAAHDHVLPPELADLLREQLREGERILWVSRPRAAPFTARSLPIFLFGVFWIILILVMIASDGSLSLFHLPFLAAGLVILGYPLYQLYVALHLAYVITDRCAYRLEGGFNPGTRLFLPRRFPTVERRQYRNGSGDLIFSRAYVSGERDGEESLQIY